MTTQPSNNHPVAALNGGAEMETWRFVIYPVLLLVMMLLRPQGLFGNFEVPFLRQLPFSPRQPAAAPPSLPVAEQQASQ